MNALMKQSILTFLSLCLFCLPADSWAQDVQKLEYFFGDDPGIGQGISLNLPIVQDATTTFSVDMSGLPEGIHSLSVRSQDEAQVWSLTQARQVYKISPQSLSAEIVEVEYFIDDDPGLGNGTPVPISPDLDINGLSFAIDFSNFDVGFHSINVRSRNALGVWSLTNQRLFYQAPSMASQAPITRIEYFFDTDPGFGNATALSNVTPGTDITKTVNISLNSLPEGFHSLFIRARDANGTWSLTNQWLVFKLPPAGSDPDLVEAEYFWDSDPGIGNGTPVPAWINSQDVNDKTFAVSLASLDPGFHIFQIRSKDENGVWSLSNPWWVYKTPGNTPDIAGAEYFWNVDPGWGNGTPVPGLTDAQDVNNLTFSADLSGLDPGFNILNLRSVDANGLWSHTNRWLVYKIDDPADRPDIVAAEYFIDVDPGIGLATTVSLPVDVDIANETIIADLTGLPIGEHKLFIRTQDSNGVWTLTSIHDFFGGDYPQRPGSGTALNLAEANDAVNVPDNTDLQFGNGDFTVECWVKNQAMPTGTRPVAMGRWNSRSNPGTNEWAFELSSDGTNTRPNFVLENGTSLVEIAGPSDMPIGEWYHLAAAKWGDEIFLFVNGLEVGSAFVGGQTFNVVNGLDLTIGNSNQNNADANIVIDEIRLWNVAISSFGIRNWMCKKLRSDHPNYNNLVSYYRFDDGSGTSLVDVRGSNIGTLENTTGWETSGAPIGDESAWVYDSTIDFELNHPSGDGLGVEVTTGNPDGVHIYRVDEAPNTAIPPSSFNSLETARYYGVFVAGGSNPTYTVQYDFIGSTYSDPVDFVGVATRADNAGTIWSDLQGEVILPPGIVEQTGQTGTEYILGTSNDCTLLPSFAFPGPDTIQLCSGSSTTLVGPGGFSQYDWSNGASSSSLSVSNPDTYILTVTNAQGCRAVDTVVVEVNAVPQANISISGNIELCAGESVTLMADAGLEYQWNNGETTQSITVSVPGNYVLTVTNAAGCSSFSPSVPVSQKNPLIGFSTIDPSPVYYLTTTNPTVDVSFNASVNGTISTYEWDFGDGSTSTSTNPTHTYSTEGFYDIELIVEDDSGCRDTLLLPEYVSVWRVFPTVNVSPPGVIEHVVSTSFIGPFTGCIAFPNGGNNGGGYVYTTANGGSNWTISQIGSADAIQDIYLTGSSGYILGSNGLICVSNNFGSSWVPFNTGTNATFYSGWFQNPNFGWAVGSGGTICFYNGSTWQPFTTGVNNTFYGVYGFGPGAWAVGSGGIICIYNGTSWIPQNSGTVQQLNGVYFVDGLNGYAVGNGGTILRTINGGVNWINVSPGFPWNINAVYCLDANRVLCVGDNGVVLISQDGGVTWELFSIGSNARLTDCTVVNCVGYITGVDGQVFQFDFPGCVPTPLPVEFVQFSGKEQNQQVLLNWETATEIDNDYFEVQRSTNGFDFETIGRVRGAGTTNDPQYYTFLDELPYLGDNYYRLKQVDYDESFEFSKVIIVSIRSDQESILLTPNLVLDRTWLEIYAQKEQAIQVEIIDELGRRVKFFNSLLTKGANRIEITVSDLPAGAYFLNIIGHGLEAIPFIKPE